MRRLLIALVALIPLAGQAAPTVGQLYRTGGDVEVYRAGQTLPAVAGSGVEVGDEYVTDLGQAAALRMSDDQLVAIGATSRFQVVSYQFGKAGEVEADHARYRLDSGSVRMISGLIAKRRPGSVVLETPHGDITTLGTDYIAGVCGAGCAAPGIYISVNSGSVTVSGGGGSQTAAAGQVAFVPAGGGAPSLVASLPPQFIPVPDPAVIMLTAVIPGGTLRLEAVPVRVVITDPICDPEASPTLPECTANR